MGCPLYIRSVYTLLSSMCTISKIISKAKEYGYASVGLVDRNVLSGSMAFKKEALKNGIKPIFGLEFDIEIDSRIYTMLLYSKNDDGFKNLMSLSSYINTSENKVINIDILNEYRNNNYLVLLSDNMPLTIALQSNGDIQKAFDRQQELFGSYIVGIVDNDLAGNRVLNNKILEEETVPRERIK